MYSIVPGPNGIWEYKFKLGDFGLAIEFPLGLTTPPPIPPSSRSSWQNEKFSTSDYKYDDDLYGVGYIMKVLASFFPSREHPDPEYRDLIPKLMAGEDVSEWAFQLADWKYNQMTSGYI